MSLDTAILIDPSPAQPTAMTAQFAEKLIIDGKSESLCTNPLSEYFALSGQYFDFKSTSTALWRGYVGTWEIVYDRLYLLAVHGELKNGQAVTLDLIFPGFPDRVFAHWYSGTLRIPQGGLIEYKHAGYSSIYERDLLIQVERGLVRCRWIRENQQPAADTHDNGYVIRSLTYLHLSEDEKRDGQ